MKQLLKFEAHICYEYLHNLTTHTNNDYEIIHTFDNNVQVTKLFYQGDPYYHLCLESENLLDAVQKFDEVYKIAYDMVQNEK